MQARAAPLNAQAAPRQLEQPATPTHARAAPGKTLQELSSSVKIKDLRCEKYIRTRDMCKTNVMHRQEDCMCKHVCTQPIRRSERMSLKEKQGMERKEKKKKRRDQQKGKGKKEKTKTPTTPFVPQAPQDKAQLGVLSFYGETIPPVLHGVALSPTGGCHGSHPKTHAHRTWTASFGNSLWGPLWKLSLSTFFMDHSSRLENMY